jgi:tetratricopeptide (TPR) repeat protein
LEIPARGIVPRNNVSDAAGAASGIIEAAEGIVTGDWAILMPPQLRLVRRKIVIRHPRLLPTIAVLLFVTYLVSESLFGVLVAGGYLGLLPVPFNSLASYVYLIGRTLIPISCVLLFVYDHYSKRSALARARDSVKLTKIGNDLLVKGEYESAVRALTASIRTYPELAAAFINRGCAHYHLGELDEALADLDKAISLDPQSPQAFGWRGNTWFRKGELEEALADYDSGLRLAPDNVAMLVQRGQIWLKKADLVRALADFDRAVACAPEDEMALRFRAICWMLKKDHDRAIADFTEVIRLNAARADSFRDRGLCWHFKGENEKGLADLEEAIRLDPADGIAFNNRGACRLKRGEFAAALSDFKEAIRLEPKHPNAYKNLAWLAATCPNDDFRNGAQAVEWARKALLLAGKEPVEWFPIVAAAHAEAGDFAEAIHWQTRFRDECQAASRAEAEARLEWYRSAQPYREVPPRAS